MKTTILSGCFSPRNQRALAGVPTATGSRRPVGTGRAANKLAFPLAPSAISLVSLITVSIFAATVHSSADSVTLSVAPVFGSGSSTNFIVPTNVTAQIVSAYCFSQNIANYLGGGTRSVITVALSSTPSVSPAYYPGTSTGSVDNLPIVVGPATITLTATNGSSLGNGGTPQTLSFCTIQTTSSTSFTPSTAVVIPNDGGGPVTVILESSVDLVNWTPALPGTYGTTTSNRFFRVRAQR